MVFEEDIGEPRQVSDRVAEASAGVDSKVC